MFYQLINFINHIGSITEISGDNTPESEFVYSRKINTLIKSNKHKNS